MAFIEEVINRHLDSPDDDSGSDDPPKDKGKSHNRGEHPNNDPDSGDSGGNDGDDRNGPNSSDDNSDDSHAGCNNAIAYSICKGLSSLFSSIDNGKETTQTSNPETILPCSSVRLMTLELFPQCLKLAPLQSGTQIFGPTNPVADAKISTNKLGLAENGKAINHFVEYNRYKSRTRFNDQSYYIHIMSQMPMCICCCISKCIPLPPDYKTFQAFILSIDAQYQNFKVMESNSKKALGSNHNSGSSSSSSNQNSSNYSNTNCSGSNNDSKDSSGSKSNNNFNWNNNSRKNNAGKKNNTSNNFEDLSSKLGPNGKLISKEKQC